MENGPINSHEEAEDDQAEWAQQEQQVPTPDINFVKGNAPNSRTDDDAPARPSTGLDKWHAYNHRPTGWAYRAGSGRTQ